MAKTANISDLSFMWSLLQWFICACKRNHRQYLNKWDYLSSNITLFIKKVMVCIPLFWGKWSVVAQSCPTVCDPMDCSLLGSSIHEIFQARFILERAAISFSRGSSWPWDWTQVSHIVGRHFNVWATHQWSPSSEESTCNSSSELFIFKRC